MCIAVPGKLIEKQGSQGKVSVRGNILPVELGIVNANVGDYLLIHAGCAISVMGQDEAEELNALFELIESYND